jgi:hypothetical protein
MAFRDLTVTLSLNNTKPWLEGRPLTDIAVSKEKFDALLNNYVEYSATPEIAKVSKRKPKKKKTI